MENLLRLSAKINTWLGVIIIALTVLTYFVHGETGGREIQTAAAFSLFLALALIVTAVIARRSLAVDIEDDDKLLSRKLMRIGTIIAIILLVISTVGLALGISTGTISYVYIVMIPAMIFYCYCMWLLRPPKEEKTIKF
ncbi:MAG: hypothetical protein IJ132_03520 [Firmicutes bacterium]|nr:hypothetical protein [Bacillota bacterium]